MGLRLGQIGSRLGSDTRACACLDTSAGAGAPADKHTPCALLSKTAHATAGATANKNSITDCIRKARRNGWAPLNRLAPHPFFPSCCFFMFSVRPDWLLIGFSQLPDDLRRYLSYIAALVKAREIIKQKQFFILETVGGDNIGFQYVRNEVLR